MSQTSSDPLGNRDYKLSPRGLRIALVVVVALALAVVGGVGWAVLRLWRW